MRKATPGALKHPALLQNAGHTLALQQLTRRFLPVVRDKRVAIQCCNSTCDALLQAQQKGLDIGNINALQLQLLRP